VICILEKQKEMLIRLSYSVFSFCLMCPHSYGGQKEKRMKEEKHSSLLLLIDSLNSLIQFVAHVITLYSRASQVCLVASSLDSSSFISDDSDDCSVAFLSTSNPTPRESHSPANLSSLLLSLSFFSATHALEEGHQFLAEQNRFSIFIEAHLGIWFACLVHLSL